MFTDNHLYTRYCDLLPRPRKAVTTLKLISYNIQVGIAANSLRDYIVGGWRHVLPDQARNNNLDHIADVLKDFDIVALQEVDGGSLRSGYVNQVEYLAERGDFPFCHTQLNRNFGRLGQHANGMLTRIRPHHITNHRLPGMIPGRGAIMLRFGDAAEALVLIIAHLALGQRARQRQLDYLAKLLQRHPNAIVMGDMNCTIDQLHACGFLARTALEPTNATRNTFPSWRPSRNIDHILVSRTLAAQHVEVLHHRYSDHLPVALEINLPSKLLLE